MGFEGPQNCSALLTDKAIWSLSVLVHVVGPKASYQNSVYAASTEGKRKMAMMTVTGIPLYVPGLRPGLGAVGHLGFCSLETTCLLCCVCDG